MSRLWFTALAVWVTKLVTEKIVSLQSASRKFGFAPFAGVLLLHPFRTPAVILGRWFPFSHQVGSWYAKFRPYARYGSTCIASTIFWGSLPTLWLADADAIRKVATETDIFQKDMEAYEVMKVYGDNLVGTEGADWKRHRSVAKPAFNEAGNAFVWMETTRVVNEWFGELDAAQEKHGSGTITIDAMKDLVQVTLLVIPSAGFGRRASWQEDSSTTPPPGHKMAFRPAVTSALEHLFTRVLTPEWLYALSEGMYLPFIGPIVKDTKNVYEALKLHMLDLVSLSRAWVVEGKVSNMDAALLRNLVEANMTMQDDEGGPHVHKTLTDDELLSNTWNFLLAGHETSAHSLSFTVGLLALYPDVQDKIYEETIRLWPSGCPTTASNSSYKESMPKLPYTLAVFQETIRLFPSIVRLSKLVQTDTNLQARRFATTSDGDIDDIQEFLVSVPRGSIIMIDILGVHTSPIYWERDAGEFKPERFLDTESYRWPRDAFFAFSTGPRNCIGQRFALTEGVCLLASLVHSYRISVPEHLQGAPFEEQKRLMLKWIPGLTMTPTNCFVRVQRRSSK